MKSEEESNDYISPYSISNQTGYPLEIRRNNDKSQSKNNDGKKPKDYLKENLIQKIFVDNNSSIILQVENDESYFFYNSNLKNLSKNSVNLSVEILKKQFSYKPLNDINIQRIHLKEHTVYGGKENYKILTNVVFEAETNKKILTISSPVVLRNITQKIIEIKFLSKNSSNLLVNPTDTVPIPFDMIKESIQIRFNDVNVWSLPCSLYILSDQNLNSQIHIQDKYVNIRSENEDSYKKVLTFEPPFTIKNCFPISIQLKLRYGENEENNTKKGGVVDMIMLEPQDTYDIYDIPFETALFCQILIKGFNWSPITQINSKKALDKVNLDIFDEKNFKQAVILQCYTSNNGARKFYLYCKAYLINETNFNLWVFTNNDKKRNPIAGQKKLSNDKEDHNDKILLLNDETNLVICDFNNKEETSREISLEVVNNTLVEFYTKQGGFIQMAIRMNLLCIGI